MVPSVLFQFVRLPGGVTKFITGMRDCSYRDILSLLRLYSLQGRRERYCIIYVWKIIEDLVPNFSKPLICTHSERRGIYCVVSHVNIGRLVGGMPFDCLIPCQNLLDVRLLVLSIISNIHLILT